jgi:uncharacterized protein
MRAKLKRFLTSLLPVAENRRGACNRCGQCCKLPFPCPFLRFDEQGLSSCAVYYARPPSCRKYPRIAAENLTPQTCGYYFVSPDQIRVARPQTVSDTQTPAGAAAFEHQ